MTLPVSLHSLLRLSIPPHLPRRLYHYLLGSSAFPPILIPAPSSPPLGLVPRRAQTCSLGHKVFFNMWLLVACSSPSLFSPLYSSTCIMGVVGSRDLFLFLSYAPPPLPSPLYPRSPRARRFPLPFIPPLRPIWFLGMLFPRQNCSRSTYRILYLVFLKLSSQSLQLVKDHQRHGTVRGERWRVPSGKG